MNDIICKSLFSSPFTGNQRVYCKTEIKNQKLGFYRNFFSCLYLTNYFFHNSTAKVKIFLQEKQVTISDLQKSGLHHLFSREFRSIRTGFPKVSTYQDLSRLPMFHNMKNTVHDRLLKRLK